MNWLLDWIGKVPTTQARVCVTLACVIATTIRYVASANHVLPNGNVTSFWVPSYEWLLFLVVMSGLDGLTFASKRFTDTGYVAAKQGAQPDAPIVPDPEVKT